MNPTCAGTRSGKKSNSEIMTPKMSWLQGERGNSTCGMFRGDSRAVQIIGFSGCDKAEKSKEKNYFQSTWNKNSSFLD